MDGPSFKSSQIETEIIESWEDADRASQFLYKLLEGMGLGLIQTEPSFGRVVEPKTKKYEFGRMSQGRLEEEAIENPDLEKRLLWRDWYECLERLEPLPQEEVLRLLRVLNMYRLVPASAGESKKVFDFSVFQAREAFDLIFSHNLRLVRTFAMRYRKRYPQISVEDLFQAASMGLMRAIDLFDPLRGYQFSTYAVNWIKQSLVREALNTFTQVRIPIYQIEDIGFDAHMGAWLHSNGERVDLSPGSDHWPLSNMYSLEDLAEEDLADALVFREIQENTVEKSIEVMEFQDMVVRILSTFSIRERAVLRGRLDLGLGDEQFTLEEIGEQYGVTRERIRQIEGKVRKRLILMLIDFELIPEQVIITENLDADLILKIHGA